MGTYEVIFVAEFTNGQELIRKQASLFITIWEPASPNPAQPDPTEDLPDWNEIPKTNLNPDPVDPDDNKPEPFIESLSDTGLLRIGWNQLI